MFLKGSGFKSLSKKFLPISLVLTTMFSPLYAKDLNNHELTKQEIKQKVKKIKQNYCENPLMDIKFYVLPNPSDETLYYYYETDDNIIFDLVEKEEKVLSGIYVTPIDKLLNKLKDKKGYKEFIDKVENIKKYVIKNCKKNHKEKKNEFNPSEFNPPVLPYCRIERADGMGVVIYYYPEWYKKTGDYYRLSWILDNLFRPSVGNIVIDYMYSAGYNVDLGTEDAAFIQGCLLRATREVLENTGGGIDGYGPYSLVVKEMKGNIFGDYIIKMGPPPH